MSLCACFFIKVEPLRFYVPLMHHYLPLLVIHLKEEVHSHPLQVPLLGKKQKRLCGPTGAAFQQMQKGNTKTGRNGEVGQTTGRNGEMGQTTMQAPDEAGLRH